MNEIWKPVPGYESHYEVSSLGNVRRIAVTQISPEITRHGYRRVTFSKNGRRERFTLARMIALTFHGTAPEGKAQVNHKDGNKLNDSASNLEWVSARENTVHKIYVLGKGIGETHHSTKLTAEQVREIRVLYAKGGISQPKLARKYGVTQGQIWSILHKRTWKHLHANA